MAEIKDPENTIIIELKDGPVTIELLPDVAPDHVARMKELAREGAYDDVVFHRVIEGFMAQTGDVEHGLATAQPAPRRDRRVGQARPHGRVLAPAVRPRHARRGAGGQPEQRQLASSSSTLRTTTS